MTQAITFPRIKIPNAAYVADTWSSISGFSAENYAISTLSAVPSLTGDITAILICDSNSTGGTYGVQNADESADIVLASAPRSEIAKFIKLSATNTLDIFASNLTNVSWNLVGYTNHITHITPVDKAGTTGAGQFTIDCSADVPSGSGAVLIECSKGLKVGAALNLTTQQYPNAVPRNHLIVPLNASRQFFFYSGGASTVSGDIRILGWLTPEAVQFETTFPLLAHAGDSVWRDSTQPAVTTVFDRYQLHSGSDSILANIRTGSSAYNVVDKNMAYRTRWVIPSSNGLVDSWANNSTAKFTRYMGLVGDTDTANITGIDTLQAGATATVTFNKSVTTVNKLRIASVFDNHYIDVTTGFGGSGDTRTFTVPNLSNSADGIRLGAVIVTPTTDGGVGADFTGMAYTKADYKFTNIEDVVAGNVCEGDDPALAPDDQLIKPTTTSGDINKGGVLIDPSAYVGTQEIWRYVVSEFKWYNFTITTEGGVAPAPSDSGLTASGLTHRVFTVSGLTHRGL
jgi:hypothetical protein